MSETEYAECLREAQKKGLKLCPEGYCTAKSKFKVYPSAYANGYAAQVCKGSKPDLLGNYKNSYENKEESNSENSEKDSESGLSRWFQEKWVNVCEKDENGEYLPCGRNSADLSSDNYPYCRPLKKLPSTTVKTVNELTEKELEKMCQTKRQLKQGIAGKPTRVYLKD